MTPKIVGRMRMMCDEFEAYGFRGRQNFPSNLPDVVKVNKFKLWR